MVIWEDDDDLEFLGFLDDIVHGRFRGIGRAYDREFWTDFTAVLTSRREESETLLSVDDVIRRGRYFRTAYRTDKGQSQIPEVKRLMHKVFKTRAVPSFPTGTTGTTRLRSRTTTTGAGRGISSHTVVIPTETSHEENWESRLADVLSDMHNAQHITWEALQAAIDRFTADKLFALTFLRLPNAVQIQRVQEMGD